jgi:hypothetical protein
MGASPSPLAGALEILPLREIRERGRPAHEVGVGIPVDRAVDALVDLVRWELGSSEGPELAELTRLFSRLGEEEQWEVLREFARRQAEALARRREEFLHYLDERFPDIAENTDLYVYYHALMREYEIVTDRAGELKDQHLPMEVLSTLATHAAVLVARLDGRADDETFEWILGELMASVDVIPVLAQPEHGWAGDMLLKLAAALA